MTWTAPDITRADGPLAEPTGDERTLADAWLDLHRQTLLWKCSGLTAGQLKLRAVDRSELSLLGLVRHMAEVERNWFRTRFAGAQLGYAVMIQEYARHNGHADLLRESIDGRTGH